LHALGGAAAPADLAGDLRRLMRLPATGLANLWQVLGPCLADELTKDTERLLDVFCSAYGVTSDDLGRAIKAARFLIQASARLDLPRPRFGEDLATLCPDAPLLHEVLLAGYEPAKAKLRQAIVSAALLGHGKLLVDVEWRLDLIEATGSGARIRQPVTMLTLHYREGRESGRVTLQALPDMIEKLRATFEEGLPRGKGPEEA
jgi:hypothetical protein